jgi:lysophospholipase L1-like esterase
VLRLAGRLALALACVAAVWLAGEAWVLPAAMGLPRDAALLGFTAAPGQVDDVAISAMGFAGDAIAREKPPGTVRVLTLGGSVLFDRRMTTRLKRALEPVAAEAGARLELVGAALRGHTTWASRHKWHHWAGRGFDVVLVYHGINDLFANHVAPEDFRDDYGHLGAWYVRGPVLDRSLAARIVFNRWLYRKPPVVHGGGPDRSAEVFARNLEALVGAIRAAGATPVLSTFAWSIPPGYTHERFLAGELPYRNPEGYDPVPVALWGPVPWVAEGLARRNVAIHRLAAERGVPLLDAQRRMAGDPAWFGDVCHFGEAGTERFVAFVAERFAREGWLGGG